MLIGPHISNLQSFIFAFQTFLGNSKKVCKNVYNGFKDILPKW